MPKQGIKKRPNPQGKGVSLAVGYLLEAARNITLPPFHEDSAKRVFADYLSSLLVLSCSFNFKPVMNREYYIYYHNNRLVLSLVSPDEGGHKIYDEYWAACMLSNDCTWLLKDCHKSATGRLSHDITENLSEEQKLWYLLKNLQQGSVGRYDKALGYYQNILNYALGKSVGLRSHRLLGYGCEEEMDRQTKLLQDDFMEK